MEYLIRKVFNFSKIITPILFLFIIGCQPPDASIKLKPITDKYVEAWNTGNLDLLDEIIATEFVRHTSPASNTAAVGLDSLKKVMTAFRVAYPDFNVVMDEEIYLENKAVARWTYEGTNTGPGRFPPTGGHVKSTGISLIHIENGKIVEEWAETDNLSSMLQLGFTLTPPVAEETEEKMESVE